MELLLILLLLVLSDKDARTKETLKEALAFFREKRELIRTLAQMSSPAASAAAPAAPATSTPPAASAASATPPAAPASATGEAAETPNTEAQKNSPVLGGEQLRLLEAFLKQRGI